MTSAPTGVSCGAPCTKNFVSGTAACTLAMDTAKTASATFVTP